MRRSRCGSMASTTTTVSGWTDGKAVANARRGTTIASSSSARQGLFTEWTSTRGISRATSRHRRRSMPASPMPTFLATMIGHPFWIPSICAATLINYHALPADLVVTHLRLNIFPDGGVARLRLFGEIRPTFAGLADKRLDLVALANGGRAVICNDEHYGSMHNLNLEGRGINMGDGWETARRRVPGNDWVVLALGARGVIDEVVIDTAHFKGNYPDRAMLQAAAVASGVSPDELARQSADWPVLMPEQKLSADAEHRFDALNPLDAVTHVRLSIFPDGGVSRVRLLGRLVST